MRFEVMKQETGWLLKMATSRHVALRFRAKPKYCKQMSSSKTVLDGDERCVIVNDRVPWSVRFGSPGKDFPRAILLSDVGVKSSLPKRGSDDVGIEDSETPKTIFRLCIEVYCERLTIECTILVKRYIS